MRTGVSIRDLEYVDDMALVCDSCLGMGSIICSKKTKILVVYPTSSINTQPRPVPLGVGMEPTKVVEDFEYLGSMIAQDCLLDRKMDRRISKAAHAFHSLYRVLWCRKGLKVVTKLHLW